MNDKDLSRLASIEMSVTEHLGKLGISGLADLEDFPFTSIEDVSRGYQNKSISLGADYMPDLINVYGTSVEIGLSHFFSLVPILIALGDIVLAITHKRWIYVLGVVFALIGFSLSSPYAPMRRPLELGGIVGFLWMLISANWAWVIVIGSFLLSLVATMTIRSIYSYALAARAVKSEMLFCHMFLTGRINIRDNVSGNILRPQK